MGGVDKPVYVLDTAAVNLIFSKNVKASLICKTPMILSTSFS